MGVSRCVLLFLLVHHQHCAAADGGQPLEYSENGSADLAPGSPAEQTFKFPLRKCCPPGKVYHQFSNGGHEAGERCRVHPNADQGSSILIEVSQQLFFGKSDNDSVHFEANDFGIISGFPEDCNETMVLEPDTMPSDRFYPLINGDLAVPHRFWIFPPESHCMEDFFADHDYNTVKRVAIICLEKARMFPSEAVDENNRLQLSFLDDRNTTTGLESLSGRPVIRKCCDINEVYWVMNHTCVPKQGYATQYFDDLLSGGDDLFVRTEQFKNCDGLLQAEYFEWHSDWTIQIQINVDIEGCAYLFTSDEYCVDDFVVSLNEELPETITLVTVCPTKAKSLLPPSVYERCFNESPSVPPSNDIDLKQEQDTQAISSHETKISHLPKCCPRDYVIEDGFCRLYEHYDQKAKLQSTLLDSVKEFLINAYNKTLKLDYEFTLKCDFTRSIPLHEASQSNNSAPQLALKFRTSGQNETALHFSYYQENYWDYDSKIPHYCVDMKHSPPDNRIYEPHVFYCHLPSSVSGRYPALLYISSIGLMLTFVMYFLTPAKKNAAPVEDGEAKPGPKKTCYFNNMLANTIASRNFLCHISSLCLAFVSLAITQHELVEPGQPGCVAIGYTIYAATIASFSWFTVHCFHYFCMFRLSLLTKNNIIFVPYSLFGWGIPLVALAIAITAQFHSNSNLPKSINPNMGLLRCWFGNETSVLVFFYVPICFLLSLSSIFFTSLLLLDPNLRRCPTERKNNSRLRSNRSKLSSKETHQDAAKKVDVIYFATGAAWIFEITAWIPMHFTNVSKTEWETLSYLFEVGNVLNSLRGVFVFVLYVLFQRGVRGQLFLRLMKMSSALGIVLQRKGPESASDSTRRIISTQNSTTSTTANTASKRSATDVKQSSTTSETRAPSCTPDEVTEL